MAMNIPLGKPLKRFVNLNYNSIVADLKEFMENKGTGYLAVLVQGKHSLQEGFLAIDSGVLFASAFEYLKYEKKFLASEALKRSFNLFLASPGIYDIYKWNAQQVELFKVFNDNMILLETITPIKLNQVLPKSQVDFESQDLAQFLKKEPTRKDLIKKYKLGDVEEGKSVEEEITSDLERGVIEEHKQLEGLLEEFLEKLGRKDEKKRTLPHRAPPVGHGVEKFRELALKEEKEE